MARFLTWPIFLFLFQGIAFGQYINTDYRIPVQTLVFHFKEDTISKEYIVQNHERLFAATADLTASEWNTVYWFKLDFKEQLKNIEGDTIYIVTGALDSLTLFYGDDILKSQQFDFASDSYRKYGGVGSTLGIPIAKNSLIEGRYIFMKVKFLHGYWRLKNIQFQFNTQRGEWISRNFVSAPSVTRQFPIFINVGITGVLAVFNIILFLFIRSRQYVFYLLFLVFQLLFFTRGSLFITNMLFGANYVAHYVFTEVAQMLTNLCYMMFVKFFLETNTTLPKLDRVIRYIAVLLLLAILFDFVILFVDPYFKYQRILMYTERYVLSAFAFVGVLYIWIKSKEKLKYFIITGTVIYTSGALLTLFMVNLEYMMVGSALENIIFGLGLGYKLRSATLDKLKYEVQSNIMRLSALRAQMNPHFIFNSLNSIQHLIIKNDRENALKYLTRFSSLLRKVLESSMRDDISLKEEIDLLKVYLDLENLRFAGSFTYSIKVEESIDIYNVTIPIMVLQPYIENAIVHGLLPKQGERKLEISFIDYSDFVLCKIQDNGVGRKAAQQRLSQVNEKRTSRGLSISRDRLGFKHNEAFEDPVTITDLPEGTLVEIKIRKHE